MNPLTTTTTIFFLKKRRTERSVSSKLDRLDIYFPALLFREKPLKNLNYFSFDLKNHELLMLPERYPICFLLSF